MNNQVVSVGTDLFEMISLEDMEKFPDLLKCLRYMLLKESTPSMTMDQITEVMHSEYSDFPATRPGAYYRIETWRKNGTMRVAEEIYLIPKIEEMRVVVSEAITNYPLIVRRLMTAALTTANARDTLEIIKYLKDLIKPEIDKVEEVGDKEVEYAKSKRNFNPMAFVDKMKREEDGSIPPESTHSS